MPKVYYTGLISSNFGPPIQRLLDDGPLSITEEFILLPVSDNDNVEIGWDYVILWNSSSIQIVGKSTAKNIESSHKLLRIPYQENIGYDINI